MSYRNLEIWKIADKLALEIHSMTLKDLPGFEMYETGSQIRRSSKSAKSNIAEGYGRRSHLKEYIRFLIMAQGSVDETLDHLETLYKTKSLKDKTIYESLHELNDKLGRKLNRYIQAIKRNNPGM